MRSKVLSFLVVLGLALILSASASAQGTEAGTIKVARVAGDVSVTVKATGEKSALAEGSTITQGTIVSTGKGSSVVLVFSNGASVNLAEDSDLDIAQFTQDPFSTAFSPAQAKSEPTTSSTHLNLVRGELVSKVLKLNVDRGSDFVVQTPVGAAGIRGTVFQIIYRVNSNGQATYSLTTTEGSVHVTLATGKAFVPFEVSANKQVTMTATVTVNSQGIVSVTLPSGASVPILVVPSSNTTQGVEAASNIIAQVAALISITPTPSTPPPAVSPPTPSTPQPATAPTTVVNPVIQPINPTVVSPSH